MRARFLSHAKFEHVFAVFKTQNFWKGTDHWNISPLTARKLLTPLYLHFKLEVLKRKGGIAENIMEEQEAEWV
jgi:hypothetical protein